MLHITNGDSAVNRIARAGISGEILAWRDVLHEGPVPARLTLDELRPVRAHFIAGQGWGDFETVLRDMAHRDATLAAFRDHEQVVLWFEHDLYDQLQLIQLLDWFAQQDLGATTLSLVGADEYLGTLTPDRLHALFACRHTVSAHELALGQAAWRAFRAPDPTEISALLLEDTAALPFLKGALLRHLEEFPALTNGLSRSESQALEAIVSGRSVLREAYTAAHHDREERIFLGDSVFAMYLERLSQASDPLVLFEDGGAITASHAMNGQAGFWERRARVTETGRAVLAGRSDWLAINGIDRWLGGVHLSGRAAQWRWNAAAGQLQASDGGAA